MNHSKLYVPNPQKWIDFLKQISSKQKLTQYGAGKMLHITTKETTTTTKPVEVKSVAPAQQTVEQAKSELQRENINPSSIEKVFHKSKGTHQVRIKKRINHYPVKKAKTVGKTAKKSVKKNKKSEKKGKNSVKRSRKPTIKLTKTVKKASNKVRKSFTKKDIFYQ